MYVNIFTQSYADVLKSCNVHCIGTMKEKWLLEDVLLYTCRHLFNRLTWTYASVLDDMVAMSGKEFLVCLFLFSCPSCPEEASVEYSLGNACFVVAHTYSVFSFRFI